MLPSWILFTASCLAASVEKTSGSLTNPQVQQELRHRLSDGTEIYFPSSPEYTNYTLRWSEAVATYPDVVVVPATRKDVAATVKFANAIKAPFYVVNRAHGATVSQLAFQHGIQINMRQLTGIQIAADGNSAVMGGGVYVDEIVRTLDAKGKVTTTGACGCVGAMGPALGGGNGQYQGYFGLATDQIISLDVVLADGSATKVSAKSNPDLFWGMRGAGHNFGIVTQFEYKIYDRPVADWYYCSMTFTSDKLEKVFDLVNIQTDGGKQPKELNIYTLFLMDPQVSTVEPVIIYSVYYAGSDAQAQPYLAPFLALNPVTTVNNTVPYPDLANAIGDGVNSPLCQKGGSSAQYPVGLKTYNTTANRAVHTLFKNMIAEQPAFRGSTVQFEKAPMQKVQSIDPASTAYAHRDDDILTSFTISYAPSTALDALTLKYGRQARALLHEGEPQRPLNAYVNYAHGDETLEQVYGYEPWRLKRLKALKVKYDPQNQFRFYNPIVV